MSIIKSPYEISIWRDVLIDGVPKEQKVCAIGSDKMTSQSRAFSPNFMRNANGEKKLSFKMYKQYIDIISGEKVVNPFVDNLINETKVKLYYEDKWYDFIVKDINENSATHLCTYQLEDALVRELSKNGFGITLDAELNNNLGDAKELANYVLAETDWTADSEVFVEKVDEALVYVKLPANTTAVHLLDQVKDENGGYSMGVTEESVVFHEDTTVLAFYSSCKNKPYRFQFIYSNKGYDRATDGSYVISRKDTRTIDEKDCQYYIDIGDKYTEPNKTTGTAALELYLPEGWGIGDVGKRWDGDKLLESDSILSSWYRGDRYGYAQQAVYVPLLEKYCQKFKSAIDKQEYLGYTDSEFVSPTLIQNCINNYNFESKAGWIAVPISNHYKPTVENVYGRFDNGEFTTIIDDFYNSTYDSEQTYKAYMKMSFNNGNEFVLNSGMKDNRALIGNIPAGEEWVLDCKILKQNGTYTDYGAVLASKFKFLIKEYIYNSLTGKYEESSNPKISFRQYFTQSFANGSIRLIFKVESSEYTEKDFKNSKIYLKIVPPDGKTYYIEKIALYRKSLDKLGNIVVPDYDNKVSTAAKEFVKTGVVENRYHFFKPELVIGDSAVKTAEEVKTTVLTKLDYTQFIPVFNEGAKKIRTVSAKESNYFNILQSIAETFEGWLDLEIKRDVYGGIEEKKVTFKNYLGETNYANFRYGVNLKEIQRTTSSKNIVSKLIVKQNFNELGQDGFCTIQRAAANPTGENYIYDFQYYHNQGLMDAAEYFDTVYYLTGAQGWDARLWDDESVVAEGDFNLKGYALRVKKINEALIPMSQEIVGLTQSLVDKQAKLEVVKATKEAAASELAQIRSDFHTLFGLYPEQISPDNIESLEAIEVKPYGSDDWWSCKLNNIYALPDVRGMYGAINIEETADIERIARFTVKIQLNLSDGGSVTRSYQINKTIKPNIKKAFFTQPVTSIDLENSTVQKYLANYTTCLEREKKAQEEMPVLEEDVSQLEVAIKDREEEIEKLRNYKQKLNELFFKKYGRFVSEGTWISEEHTDDNKYYADAQSVLYNSCYPQVQYSVNVLFLSKLPGYELFKFNLGDKTKVIDEKFFGEDKEQEVIITEISEQLDDPTQDTIKVQTFKNQFQDLFQKITATVQQTQYNSGAYEKGDKFLESSLAKQSEFITNAINSAQDFLRYGQTVKQGKDGITITDDSNKQAQLRLVGGAILFSTTDPETQETTWRTGLTNEGISADLITAGQIDAGLIQIISGDGPTFRWDSYGISAFSVEWGKTEQNETVSGINTKKFVRFDKNGIYGIDNVSGIDGTSWHPDSLSDIESNATFALTWEGLKVTGENNIEARIGKNAKDGSIIKITNGNSPLFVVSNNGDLELSGVITATGGEIGGFKIGKMDSEHPLSGDIVEIDALYYEGEDALGEDTCFNITPQGKWSILKRYSEEILLPLMLQIGGKFGIANDGTIFATGADITGTIKANKGRIGGWDIGDYTLTNYSGTKDSEGYYSQSFCMEAPWTGTYNVLAIGKCSTESWMSAAFRVTKDGELFATAGKIGDWFLDEGSLYCTLEGNDTTVIRDGIFCVDAHGLFMNGKVFDSEEINSISILPNSIVMEGGESGTRFLNIEPDGIAWQYAGGGDISGVGSIGPGGNGKGSRPTIGESVTTYSWNFIIEQNGANTGYMLGNWTFNTEHSTLSDQRIKNDIQNIQHKYDLLFDSLIPRQYKYNHGTSDRIHIGFIAQELEQGLKNTGIDSQDFAALCIPKTKELYSIRYSEFIALNTWQIQLLKPRVAAIEEKISQLEAELAELKSKI